MVRSDGCSFLYILNFFLMSFMINTKKVVAIGMVMALTLGLSGCTWFSPKPTKDPMTMLQTGVTNLASKMSGEYQVKFDATLLGKDADGKAQNVTIDLAANGDATSDPLVLALNSKIKGTMSVNQDKYSLDTELRANKQSVFAILNGLTGPAAEIPKEYVAQALGKWWKIPLPVALVKPYVDSLSPTPAPVVAAPVVAPGAKKVAPVVPVAPVVADSGDSTVQRLKGAENIFKNVSGYVKNVTYDGSDTIGGLNSYRYVADLDAAKLKDFMIQYNKDKGTEPTPEDLVKLDDFLAHFTSRLTFWVSVEGEVLNKFSLVLKMDKILSDDGKSSGKGEVNFTMSFMNFGKAVTTVDPTGATEFDLFGMLGGLSGEEALGADAAAEIVVPKAPVVKK